MSDLFDEPDDATPLEPEEREGLLPTWITYRSELNQAEQANIAAGATWARRDRHQDILTEAYLRKLHEKMFGEVWTWAGDFRRAERNIGIDPVRIPVELRTALDDARYWFEHETYSPDELAYKLAGDFERDKLLASQAERFPRTCRFCHGADGVAPGDHHPNLAGQKDKYLRSQLISFIFMQRQSHIMNRTLVDFEKEKPLYSEQEVADLAFYFSSLGPAGDGKGEQAGSKPH